MEFTNKPVKLLFLFCTVVTSITEVTNEDSQIIETDLGLVRGYKAADGDYFSYLGIPFAASTAGENRFKPPQPATSWMGVYEANEPVVCAQIGRGTEDCLKLNVFTPPGTASESRLPVLVYVTGGAFIVAQSIAEGIGPLVEKGVIVVTINYRLGALGFLCLGIEEAPGNVGLRDQVASLQWVQKNIANFGGNPDLVTIFGTSAGSASVEFLVLSELTKGLFKRAIFESGSALGSWAINLDPVATAKDLAGQANFTGNNDNIYNLIDFYKRIPVNDLTLANQRFFEDPNSDELTNGNIGFVPCLEKTVFGGVEPIVTEFPLNILQKQHINQLKNVDIITIYSTYEGFLVKSNEFYTKNYAERMNEEFSIFLPSSLIFDSNETKIRVAQEIKEFYFGSEQVSEETIIPYLEFFGDSLITHAQLMASKLYSHKNKLYLMEFSYRGDISRARSPYFQNVSHAGHADAKLHVLLPSSEVSEKDQLIVDRLSTLVTNFVKYGNPTPEPTELLPITWPVLQEHSMSYFKLDKEMEVLKNPHMERMMYWDELLQEYGLFDDYEPLYPVPSQGHKVLLTHSLVHLGTSVLFFSWVLAN